ncbi:MAG: hypothetical protein KDK27_20940, partial [Leptospiraceae bacterium]|nr:hypothetical protein [Leptospiraceae bacterium]
MWLSILVFCLIRPASGNATERFDQLLDSLPNLPALLSASLSADAPPFSMHYVNIRGAERAGHAPSPESIKAFVELDKAAFTTWSAAMSRIDTFNIAQEVGSEMLIRNNIPGIRSVFHTLPEWLGVDWFAIDHLAFFGISPYSIVIAFGNGLNNSPASFTAVMNTAGFSQREIHGLTEWYRFEDLEHRPDQAMAVDAMGQRPLDPFGVSTGHAVRLLGSAERLAGANASVFSEMVAATWAGIMPGLNEAPQYRTALLSVYESNGYLIQVFLTNRRFLPSEVAVGHLGEYSSHAQRADFIQRLAEREPPALPRYDLIVLADRQEGQN